MEKELTTYKPRVTALMMRIGMAKNPVVMDALGPVERSVFLATIAKPIGDYAERELADEVAKALKYIAKDVGYRDADGSEMGYLVVRVCEILKRYYSALTLKDFRMAFEMSLTGELDEYLPKGRDGQPDRGHYQQFNAEYVCKIINAYRFRRAAVLRKAVDAQPVEPEGLSPEQEAEIHNGVVADCIGAFEYYKENGRLPELTPIAEMLYYQMLSDAGLAPQIVVTTEEQKYILIRTINALARKGMAGDVRQLEQDGTDSPDIQHGAFMRARRKALGEAFAKIMSDGLDIRNFVK